MPGRADAEGDGGGGVPTRREGGQAGGAAQREGRRAGRRRGRAGRRFRGIGEVSRIGSSKWSVREECCWGDFETILVRTRTIKKKKKKKKPTNGRRAERSCVRGVGVIWDSQPAAAVVVVVGTRRSSERALDDSGENKVIRTKR
jgi:hypothetical protein